MSSNYTLTKKSSMAQQLSQLGELTPTLGLSFFWVKFLLEIVHT